MTNRILPETLPALYRKHGVTPMRETSGYRDDDRGGMLYACGVGVTIYAMTGDLFSETRLSFDEITDLVGISSEYWDGYERGFDGDSLDSEDRDDTDFMQGYADGAAGWAAVKDLAVTR